PAALVRCARRRRGREGGETGSGHEEDDLHATLRNQKADRQAPIRSSTAAPPANRSVISRDSRLWPRREPRSSYTLRRSCSPAARKNLPPVVFAISCKVWGLGGTRMVSTYPPGSWCLTTPSGVP